MPYNCGRPFYSCSNLKRITAHVVQNRQWLLGHTDCARRGLLTGELPVTIGICMLKSIFRRLLRYTLDFLLHHETLKPPQKRHLKREHDHPTVVLILPPILIVLQCVMQKKVACVKFYRVNPHTWYTIHRCVVHESSYVVCSRR